MNLISTFRQQHEQIEEVATEISLQLDPGQLSADATDVRRKILNLLTRLKIHTSLEDDTLHSHLQHHQDRLIAAEATRLIGETESMTEVVNHYRRYWMQRGAIERDPVDFIDETRSLLTTLRQRISRENINLFDRVEREMTH